MSQVVERSGDTDPLALAAAKAYAAFLHEADVAMGAAVNEGDNLGLLRSSLPST